MVKGKSWFALSEETRKELKRRKDANRVARKARTVEDRKQRKAERAQAKRARLAQIEARRQQRPEPLDLVSPSRIRVEAMAIAQMCRELGFLLGSLDGRPCRRLSQREVIEAALFRLEASLRRKLARRKKAKPEFAGAVDV